MGNVKWPVYRPLGLCGVLLLAGKPASSGERVNVWRIDQMQEVCVSWLRAKYMVFYHPPGPMSVDVHVGVEME